MTMSENRSRRQMIPTSRRRCSLHFHCGLFVLSTKSKYEQYRTSFVSVCVNSWIVYAQKTRSTKPHDLERNRPAKALFELNHSRRCQWREPVSGGLSPEVRRVDSQTRRYRCSENIHRESDLDRTSGFIEILRFGILAATIKRCSVTREIWYHDV